MRSPIKDLLLYVAALLFVYSDLVYAEEYTIQFGIENGVPTAKFESGNATVIGLSVTPTLSTAGDPSADHLWTTGWEQNIGSITKILAKGGYIELVCQLPPQTSEITGMELIGCRPSPPGPTRIMVCSTPNRFSGVVGVDLLNGEAALGKPSTDSKPCKVQDFAPCTLSPNSGLVSFRLYGKGRSKENLDESSPKEIILKSLRFQTAVATASPRANPDPRTVTLDAGREIVDGMFEPAATIEGPARLASASLGKGVTYARIKTETKKQKSDGYTMIQETVSLVKWSKDGTNGQVGLSDAVRTATYFEFGVSFDSSVEQITSIRLEGMRRTEQTPKSFSILCYAPDEAITVDPQALAQRTIHVPDKGGFDSAFPHFGPIRLGDNKTRIFRFYAHDYPVVFQGKSNALFIDKIFFEVE